MAQVTTPLTPAAFNTGFGCELNALYGLYRMSWDGSRGEFITFHCFEYTDGKPNISRLLIY